MSLCGKRVKTFPIFDMCGTQKRIVATAGVATEQHLYKHIDCFAFLRGLFSENIKGRGARN